MVEVVSKNIEWINSLDRYYRSHANNRNNSKFYYYPDVQIDIESEHVSIIYRKLDRKTQILFGDIYGRRTYLSDVDIINIIVSSDIEIYNVICEILISYISNPITEDIKFIINDQDFYYKSIIKNNFDKDKLDILRMNSFETITDLKIKYIDLIILISLIINKEFLVDLLRGEDRVLRQSKKFLILSKFYKEDKYLNELKQEGYEISKKIEKVYYNNSIAKEIDVIFDKITL